MVSHTFNNLNLLTTGTAVPDPTGDDISGFQFNTVSATLALTATDLNDATLQIDGRVEGTNDPTGATGWFFITGEGWVGGSRTRNGVTVPPGQPNYGPWTPSDIGKTPIVRARLIVTPTRNLSRVDVTISAT
jgi:hypothetical protein